MELETLFTASKWEILQQLAEQPLSPLQLAERSSTSLANISQQLRLLEMAGLVRSERISNRDKGLPRIVYRLADDQGYLIATANEFAEKKLFKLSAYNKIILKIWFYDDPAVRYLLEKAFWRIEPLLDKIQHLGVMSVSEQNVLFCVSSPTLTKKELSGFVLTSLAGKKVRVSFDVHRDDCAGRCTPLFDAQRQR